MPRQRKTPTLFSMAARRSIRRARDATCNTSIRRRSSRQPAVNRKGYAMRFIVAAVLAVAGALALTPPFLVPAAAPAVARHPALALPGPPITNGPDGGAR